jgi:hypothetical protein
MDSRSTRPAGRHIIAFGADDILSAAIFLRSIIVRHAPPQAKDAGDCLLASSWEDWQAVALTLGSLEKWLMMIRWKRLRHANGTLSSEESHFLCKFSIQPPSSF